MKTFAELGFPGRLIAVDIATDKLALAPKCGATNIIYSATEDVPAAILRLTEGLGADLAFEAVGVAATVDLALRCLRKGGAATLIGNVTPKTEFPLQTAVTRELTIHGIRPALTCWRAGRCGRLR